jgi:hypothetical protein
MAAAEETRKLLCGCGKHLGTFTATGLRLQCRFRKDTTIVPYGLAGLRQAIAFVRSLARQFRPASGPSV